MAYYFFDERQSSNDPCDAIRATLAQLLHLNASDSRFVIEVTHHYRNSRVGQVTATNTEVMDLFVHLRTHFPSVTFIVLDGLDECDDPESMLRFAHKAASESKETSFLFLHRPTIQFPFGIAGGELSITPSNQSNRGDIGRFALAEMQDLLRRELLPSETNIGHLAEQVAQKANSMFLWVRLLAEYLRLPVLTLRKRIDVIENLTRLQGLDNIYAKIWATLQTQADGPAGSTLLRIFQWAAHSRRPLGIDELDVAITTPLDGPRDSLDAMPALSVTLGQITGALVELDDRGKVQFIHLSTLEYFRSLPALGASHCAIANTCLSYLNFSVPARPLVAVQTQPCERRNGLHAKYPLLDYSSMHWSEHLWAALVETTDAALAGAPPLANLEHMVQLLKELIYNRDKVTMWIEASWIFGTPPRILAPDRTVHEATVSRDDYSQLRDDLDTLRLDLLELNGAWSSVLCAEPNEIWEPSVPSFTKSRFWVKTTASAVRPVVQSHGAPKKRSFVVQSQISRSGNEIGIITVFPTQ